MNSLRRFISLSLLFSFLVMSYTGIVLFFAPKGRVANATHWELFGLEKTEFSALHVSFMLLFLVGMLFHIYLNYKALLSYFKNKIREFSLFTIEFMLAFGITLLFFIGTLYNWVPFSTFLDFQEELKASWVKPQSSFNQKSDTHTYGKQKLKIQP
jgi:nitric oxide reductase large subunit